MPRVELAEHKLAAWRSLITAYARLLEQIDREMTAAGVLPLYWYDVLVELAEAPDKRLRLHELAHKVVLSRSGLTRLVDRLETEGLLKRETDPTDRRGFFASLTDKGLAAMRRAWPVYAAGIQRHFGEHLNEKEARSLTDTFTRMLEAMQPRQKP